jgi:hypothetical protein
MAYDDATHNIVLFGGHGANGLLADTWVWDGSNWTQQNPSTSPSARQSAGLASFVPGGELVLFGGETATGTVTDTWIWRGDTWKQANPSSSPSSQPIGMVYDSGLKLVVFYGTDGTTWTWGG